MRNVLELGGSLAGTAAVLILPALVLSCEPSVETACKQHDKQGCFEVFPTCVWVADFGCVQTCGADECGDDEVCEPRSFEKPPSDVVEPNTPLLDVCIPEEGSP